MAELATPAKGGLISEELSAIVGPAYLRTAPEELANFSVEGESPVAIAFPADTAEVAAVVAVAHRHSLPVVPWGAGTKQRVGFPPPDSALVLSLARLNRIVSLDAANLTVEVEAGLGLAALQQQLRDYGLWFPLDPVDMDRTTVGGTLATGASGPSRWRYRTPRDLVLGVTAVTAQGEVVRGGGMTVKNVAGYDLRKLFVGSWGTLGIITQAILRLWPLPETRATLLGILPNVDMACQGVAQILHSELLPTSVELLDSLTAQGLGKACPLHPQLGEVLLMVGFEGATEAVARQTKQVMGGMAAIAALVLEGEAEEGLWAARRQVYATLGKSCIQVARAKVSVPIAHVGEAFHAAERVAKGYRLTMGTLAHAGNGIVYMLALLDDSQSTEERLARAFQELRERASALGGFLVLEAAPTGVKERVPPLPERGDYALMKRIKAELDPKGILNPGKLWRDEAT